MHAATFAPEEPRIFASFLDVLDERPTFSIIVVNAPIGFVERFGAGIRACDREARAILGRRGSAVHNAPTREVLSNGTDPSHGHLDAVTAVLLPRYREVAEEMSPYRQRTVYEGHPELSFYQLNESAPLRWSKKTEEGRRERRTVLQRKMPGAEKILDSELKGVPRKHLVDAAAMLWTARRVFGHAAIRMPTEGVWDSEGLRMEFVR
jgi:predicted RNase H-like nuclease